MLRPIAGWQSLGLTHASVTVLRSITSMRDKGTRLAAVLVQRVSPQTFMRDEQSVVFGQIAFFFYTLNSIVIDPPRVRFAVRYCLAA